MVRHQETHGQCLHFGGQTACRFPPGIRRGKDVLTLSWAQIGISELKTDAADMIMQQVVKGGDWPQDAQWCKAALLVPLVDETQ